MSELSYIHFPKLKLVGGEIPLTYPRIKYQKTGQRLFLINDTLTREDAISGKLFSGAQGQTMSNYFDEAIKLGGIAPQEILIATTFTAKKAGSLDEQSRYLNTKAIFERLVKAIQRYKPDTIVLVGFRELHLWRSLAKLKFRGRYAVLNSVSNYSSIMAYRGRLMPITLNGQKYNIVITLSPTHVATSNPKYFANTVQLAGFVIRDFETAIRGKNLYTINNNITNFPVVDNLKTLQHIGTTGTNIIVRDIPMFDHFMKLLYQAKTPCIDTEGLNLNRVYGNALLTFHFCLNGLDGWCIPFMHPKTPFTPKELEYIKCKFKYYFEYAPQVVTYFHTAKYDLFQFFSALGLRYYNHKIYDVAIGNFALDENKKHMRLTGIKEAYTLKTLAAEYGAVEYLLTAIDKQDRANMASYSIEDIAKYAILDVYYPYKIAEFQMLEAKRRGTDYDGLYKLITELGSDITYVYGEMERNGLPVDRKYMMHLMTANSEISSKIREAKDAFKQSKAVIKTNKILLDLQGVPKNGAGIYGSGTNSWIFDPNKPKHQQTLYYEVLKLEPLAMRKDGGGKVDKKFIEEYESEVPEVAVMSAWRKIAVLKNTFVDGMYKQIANSPDGKDWRIRANYILIQILTMRSSSQKPNLQNIPSRGKLSKIIKRMFIASNANTILIKLDCSAHEVRMWCNIGKDQNLAKSFSIGMLLRRKLRLMRLKNSALDTELNVWLADKDWDNKDLTQESKAKLIKRLHNQPELQAALQLILELESKGDLHKINYSLFYGIPAAEVTPDQRQGIKQTIFGVIYELSASALARSLYKAAIKLIDRKYNPKLRQLAEDSEDYADLRREYYTELKPYKDKAQGLINLLFYKFPEGGSWIRDLQANAAKTLRTVSIFGAVRHFWGYLHHDTAVGAKMNRQGPNSNIQGPSSNIVYTGAKAMLDIDWQLKQYNIELGYRHGNVVHDSIDAETKLRMLPLTLYYLEHAMSTQVHKKLREVYNFTMLIGLEIDIELGGALSRTQKWDGNLDCLLRIVSEEIDWMNTELSYKIDKKSVMQSVRYNQKQVQQFRITELEQQKHTYTPPEAMLLTPKVAANLVWK